MNSLILNVTIVTSLQAICDHLMLYRKGNQRSCNLMDSCSQEAEPETRILIQKRILVLPEEVFSEGGE